jgi:FHS family L-fucose permease-like MFS transporter
MAILGGALMPLVQGAVIDASGAAVSYIVPALCFVIVAGYGVFDLTSKSRFADNPDAEIA